jgi:hypothetical protein
MSASFVASFFAYIVTAFYSIWTMSVLFTSNPAIRWIVIIVLLLVAVYYYYTVAYVEVHPNVHIKLEQAPTMEWYLRIIALCVLFLLWVVLELFGWKYFVGVLAIQHTLYLIWDFKVRKHFDAVKKFLLLDFLGLVLSICLLFVSTPAPPRFQVSDLKDAKGFVMALRHPESHPELLCDYIKMSLSNETKKLLDEYDDSKSPSEQLLNSLVKDLNNLLKDDRLYDRQRFRNVMTLTPETLALFEQNPRGDKLIYCNYVLLKETFPELTKSSSSYSNPELNTFALGGITVLYGLMIVLGISLIKFNPRDFMKRPFVR